MTTSATYTAPATTSSQQNITITAMSVANSAQRGDISITAPAAPERWRRRSRPRCTSSAAISRPSRGVVDPNGDGSTRSVPSLTSGANYNWLIQVRDGAGKQAQAWNYFVAA